MPILVGDMVPTPGIGSRGGGSIPQATERREERGKRKGESRIVALFLLSSFSRS
jgi:hypothetical protein